MINFIELGEAITQAHIKNEIEKVSLQAQLIEEIIKQTKTAH